MRVAAAHDLPAYGEARADASDDTAADQFASELNAQKKKSAPPAPTHHAAAKADPPKPAKAKGTAPPKPEQPRGRRGATGTGVNAAGVDDGNLDASTTRVPKLTDQVAALVIPAGMAPVAAQATTGTKPDDDAPEELDDTTVIDTTIPPPIGDTSPIESAVHDLLRSMTTQQIARLNVGDDPLDNRATTKFAKLTDTPVITPDGAPAPLTKTATANAVTAPTAVAEVRAQPEQQLAATSHVHLVLGDDAQRVVVTVAVRGSAVTTTMRTADDTTSSALSRNAASLDDAMRARGLHLAELDARTDDDRRRRQQQQHPQKDDDRE